MRLRSNLSIALLLGMASPAMSRQLPAGDPLEDILRVLQVAGRGQPFPPPIRPVTPEPAVVWLPTEGEHPWAKRHDSADPPSRSAFRHIVEPTLRGTLNSDLAVVRNDVSSRHVQLAVRWRWQ